MSESDSSFRLVCPENAALNFPTQEFIPKRLTQQDEFLNEHPEYDGRNTVIAILDTGVDPATDGLQLTSTGAKKIIDCIDASGSGDVDTSTVNKVEEDGCVVGLTGRRLKIPGGWKNPTGNYHLGIKSIYSLYSSDLKKRINEEKLNSHINPDLSLAITDVLRKINEHEKKVGNESEKLSDKLDRENLNYQLEFLRSFDDLSDPGPISDCIAWNDGDKWNACIDTTFKGQLESCKVLTNYRDSYEFAYLTENDRLTYTVTIHNDGNLLEICAPNDSHGSHVASIAAACFPGYPEKDGLAPGAQIVSFKIGDTRLGTSATATALTRAFNRCVELGVDLGNMSYGGGTNFPGSGHVIDWLRTMIEKHNFMLVTSAGNEGPALSSLSPPGIDLPSVFTIGAYIPHNSVGMFHGVRNQCEQNLYPFSSRGPSSLGHLGLCVSAPGSAIANVCKFELNSKSMLNGTSMSSPNAAGNLACLLSAFKQNSIPITPYRVKLAVENSALFSKTGNYSKLDIGHGLLQLKDAFDLSQHLSSVPTGLIGFKLSVTDSSHHKVDFSQNGIYLRESCFTEKPQNFIVKVMPMFREKSEHSVKTEFERKIALVSNATHVHHTEFLFITNEKSSFQLRVDATGLEKGKVYFTEIVGFDTENPALGPLFRLPVTIIVPEEIDTDNYTLKRTLDLKPAEVSRLFFKAPKDATYAKLNLKSQNRSSVVTFDCNFQGMLSGESHNICGRTKTIMLDPGEKHVSYKNIVGGRTYEVASSLTIKFLDKDVEKVDLSIEFFGSVCERPEWNSNQQYHSMRIWNNLKFECVWLTVMFRQVAQTLRPETAKIAPLDARDNFDNGIQINNLILTYKFTVSKSADCAFHIPQLSDHMYESPLDLKIHVYHDSKYLLTTGTCPDYYSKTLDKGQHRVVVQLRHKDTNLLDKFKNLPLEARWKLDSNIILDFYKSHHDALCGDGSKLAVFDMLPGHNVQCFFAPISEDKLPVGLKSGDALLGECMLAYDWRARQTVQYPITYTLNEIGSKRISTSLATVTIEPKKSETKDPRVEFSEKIRDYKIGLLSTMKDEKLANETFEELERDNPEHLPLFLAQLKRIHEYKGGYQDILNMAQKIVELAKPDEVLQYLNVQNENDPEYLSKKKELEERKEAILKALEIKASTVFDAYLQQMEAKIPSTFLSGLSSTAKDTAVSKPKVNNKDDVPDDPTAGDVKVDSTTDKATDDPKTGDVKMEEAKGIPDPKTDIQKIEVTLKEVDDAYQSLMTFADSSDYKIRILVAKYAVAHERFGIALRCINKAIAKKSTEKLLYEARHELAAIFGWTFVEEHYKNEYLLRFSMGDCLF